MKKRNLALLVPVVLCLVTFAGAETHVTVVRVQDVSAPGSPLAASGTVQLQEFTFGNQVRGSVTSSVTARNVSDRTILALIAELRVVTSYGPPRVLTRRLECFFAPDVIKPGDEEALFQGAAPKRIEPYDSSKPPQTPRAEFRILFVQFVDGSTFGGEAFGEDLMQLRRITWRHLRDLEKTYTRDGEAGFVEELMAPVQPAEVNTFFENLRVTQRQLGTQATMARIRGALQFAEERAAGFTDKRK